MPLSPGTRLSGYEIVSLLGVGGMGEVYCARDTRLGRDVAIKVLPEAFATHAERVARFKREAQVLASLNHPHIAAIYGLEESPNGSALVLELVDGPTLADRIAQGPIPLDEALPIAKQIADALEAAHEHGIIHRDLKPANIKLTPDGNVKVLDFGLAKALEPTSPLRADPSNSPTITSPAMTMGGVILGTAAYMSPEQARGKSIDKRTDVWSFGCVLYEMLAGRRAFDGEDTSDTLAAVIRGEPNYAALPSTVQPPLMELLKNCLRKDLQERISAVSVARYVISQSRSMAQTGDKVNWEPRRSAMLLALLAASLFAAFGGAYGAYRYLGVSSRSVTQFHILPPDKTTFVIGDRVAASAIISPDGARIAFTARDESGRIQLWIRRLGALTAQPLPGTDAAQFPFWSPNSEVLAFFANDKLLKIGVSGGPPQTICDGVGTPRGGAWNRSGTIVFASAQKGLSRVSAAGGEAIMISPLANGDVRFPTFLPDDKTMLVFANRTGATTLPIERGEADLSSGVALLSLDSADMKLLVPADSSALYVDGELLFVRGSTLFAQRFDLKSRATLGEPIPITENVEATAYAGVRTFSVSDTGILTYGMGVDRLDRLPRLTWFDRKGTVLGTVGEPAPYAGIDLSPDGRSVIAHRHEGQGGDLWMLDVNRNTTSRFTFDASQDNSHPVWSPDGSQIAFASRRQGKWGIYVKPSNFGGGESRLLESVDPVAPKSWSPDGHSLVYVSTAAKTSNDIWVLPTAGGKAFPLFSSQFSESQAQVSPNGRWLSYGSNESHENNFVYVRPFPTGAGQWQLSTPGGLTSRWRKDAKELFYLNRPINPSLMAVDIDDAGPVLSAGTPRTLFDVTYVGGRQFFDGYVFGFAVSSDGQRFLIPALQPEDSKEAFRNLIAVISNWSSVLRR